MNAKFLFAATVVVSAIATFASTAALADEVGAALTRSQVVEQLDLARATGTLQRTDYDAGSRDAAVASTRTRADVVATLAAKPSSLLDNSSARSRNYNPFGTELLQPATVTRAKVRADTAEAIANGTLPRTDYDDDKALVARRAGEHGAKPILARLFRGKAS